MNMRKKLLVGITAVLLFCIALLAIIPFLFKDRILAKAKEAINTHLNARVDFSGISLSLFRNFPDISMRVYDLSIQGIGIFEGDTLLQTPVLEAGLDLGSAIRSNTPLVVHAVKVSQPRLKLLVAGDGSANYLILKPGLAEETETGRPLYPDSSKVIANIESFQIEEGDIAYEDNATGLSMKLEGIEHQSSGNVMASIYDLQTRTFVERLSVEYGAISYLRDARTQMDADIRVNQVSSTYTFSKNSLKINELDFNCEGFLRLLERGYAMDFNISAAENRFQDFFSLIPGAYLKGYENVDASGTFNLEAVIKGVYDDSLSQFPSYDLQLQVQEGKIKYPDLPLAIAGVNAKLRIFNPVSNPDSMQVDVPDLRLTIGKNPIRARFHLRTPISDPIVDGEVRGKLDLGEFAQAFPLQKMKGLRGNITADIALNAAMSQIDRQQYEKLNIRGQLDGFNLFYPLENLPPLRIERIGMTFSPRFVQIARFQAKAGKSDMEGSGRIDNILAYFSPKATMRGQLYLRSKKIDANDFLSKAKPGPAQVPEEGIKPSAAEPLQAKSPPFDRFNFQIDAAAGQVLYQTHDIRNLNAKGILMPNRFEIGEFSAKIGESDLKASGTITNAFDYLFGNGILGGNIAISSENLDLNPFMTSVASKTTTTKGSPKSSPQTYEWDEAVLLVPERIALQLTAKIATLQYAQYRIKNLSGELDIQDRAVALRDISGKTLGGTLRFNGLYETPLGKKPAFNAKLDLDQMDFSETFQVMNTFQALAPVGKFISGTLNSSLLLQGHLGKGMMPELNDLSLKGFLQTLNGRIKGYKPLQTLANTLNIQELRGDIPIQDSKNWIEVKNGIIEVKPFDFKIDDMLFTIGGKHSLKETMEYDIKARIPWKKFEQTPLGAASGTGLRQIREQAARMGISFSDQEYVNMLIHLSGNIKEPKFAFKIMGTEGGKPALVDTVSTKIGKEIEAASKGLAKKAETTISRLDSEARAGAGKIADSLAQKAREALEKEVNKTLKDTIGKTLQKEAEKVLDLKKAQAEADRLKKELEKFNPLRKKTTADTTKKDN